MESPNLLTRFEKNVLKYCNSHDPKDTTISDDILAAVSCNSEHELCLCCKYLHENGYFDKFTAYIDGGFSVRLSHKGIHYKEHQMLEVRQFVFRSIIVPVGVSIATTLILWLLQYLRK